MKIKDYLGEAETVADKKNDKLEKKMAKGVTKLSGVTNASDTDPERERLQNEQLHPLVAEHFGIIDELSKKTLGSYVKKATGGLEGAANQAYEAGRRGTEGGKNFATAVKRVKGVDKAVNKLTKEAFGNKVEINPAKKGMFAGKDKAELEAQYARLKKSGPHAKGSHEYTKMKELAFAIRAKSGWGKVGEEVDVWSVKNIKTGQVYHSSSKYPITKNSPTFKKIKAAGGDHIHAALYKNGKLVEEETISELKTSTLQSYADKAHQQAMDATYDAAHLNRSGEEKLKANAKALASKRAGGVQLAQSKIDRKDQMEEVYYETLDLFLEALMSPEVRDRIKAHELAGHKTSDHASRMKNGEMEYSFVVTQPSGKRSRHIYHGSKTKHETMSPAPKSKEAHEAGEDDDDK